MNKNTVSAMAFLLMLFASMLTISIRVEAQAAWPAPDISEMQKWYNVSNMAHDKYGNMTMDIVAKTDPPQTHRIFVFKYFDKSGNEMAGYTVMGVGYSTPKGQLEHVEVYGISPEKINTIGSIIAYLRNEDGTFTGPPKGRVQQTNAPVKTPANTLPTAGANNGNQSGNCNYNAFPPLNANASFSETLVKSAVYEHYSFETSTGGLSSPLALGITFINIRLMDSYKNTVTIVPGRGAQRRHDGAPVNATIYRFHTAYIVCRKYNNATRRTRYESDYAMFKASNGGWVSGVDSVPQIVEL